MHGMHACALKACMGSKHGMLRRKSLQMLWLQAQGRAFTIFVIEQSPEYLFNRGALLNAGFQLLQGSDYDYFAFQDVDTVPTDRGTIQYSFPVGNAPLHLTPFRIHPAANFQVLDSMLLWHQMHLKSHQVHIRSCCPKQNTF